MGNDKLIEKVYRVRLQHLLHLGERKEKYLVHLKLLRQ